MNHTTPAMQRGTIPGRVRGWAERKVEEIDGEAWLRGLDRWTRILAIAAMISTVVYILIPMVLVLSGSWR